jgi:predicted DNA-binding transcriptional regulator AlpA
MLTTTVEIVKAGLRADPSLTPDARDRIIQAIRLSEKPDSAPRDESLRLLRRTEVAKRLSVSLRTVDKLNQQGVLKKVSFPGRGRAAGFRMADVEALIGGAK